MTGRPFWLVPVLLLAFLAPAASAQDLDLAGGSGPVEITSDGGLELSQQAQTITARGHAKASRGDVTVSADELIAHYRNRAADSGAAPSPSPSPAAGAGGGADAMAGGNAEIWKVEANGNVEITTPTAHATGDHAEYSIDDAVVRLTGHDLRLTTSDNVVTAKDSLEYWADKKQAVARGQAVAVQGTRRLQADVLTAQFVTGPDNGLVLSKADAQSHVIVTAPGEIVTGDHGEYDAESGIVTLTGSVKMTRDGNQLDGGYAIVNLKTGISKLLPSAPGTGGGNGQVKGLLEPSGAGGSSQGGIRSPSAR